MRILLSSIIFLLSFLFPKETLAAYTTQLTAPGIVVVGNLTPEVFLSRADGPYPVIVEEKIVNPSFEDDLLGFFGDGSIVTGYDINYLGASLSEISPRTGAKMLKLEGDIFGNQKSLMFTIGQRTNNLRLWLNMVSNSNKLISQSHIEVRVNDLLYKTFDLGRANPELLSDGIPRASGFFAVNLSLIDIAPPINIAVALKQDPMVFMPDTILLVDDVSTNIVLATNGATFRLTQTGRYMPHRMYNTGSEYTSGGEFSLGDGFYDLRYFAFDDYGHQTATKSTEIEVNTATLVAIDDLSITSVSSESSVLNFSYLRNGELLTKIYASDNCETLATSSATLTHPLKSEGFFEYAPVSSAGCFAARVLDDYGSISSFSNFLQ